jgi:hypothetical protein
LSPHTPCPRAPIPPDALLARADALRDARDWPAAEAAYRTYLARRPEHWQIHVQLGHALKEQGEPTPRSPPTPRPNPLAPGAATRPSSWRTSCACSAAVRRRRRPSPAPLAAAPEDLLLRRQVFLFRHGWSPAPDGPAFPCPRRRRPPTASPSTSPTCSTTCATPARRPASSACRWACSARILETPGRPATTLLAYDPSAWRWWQVEEAAFRRALALSRDGAREDDPAWRAAIAALVDPDRRPDAALASGATLASLGNAWGVEDYFRGLRLLRRAREAALRRLRA